MCEMEMGLGIQVLMLESWKQVGDDSDNSDSIANDFAISCAFDTAASCSCAKWIFSLRYADRQLA